MIGRISMVFGARRDMVDGGGYRIHGTAKKQGWPGRYRIRLFDRLSGRLVREVWSAPNGAYSIEYIAYRYQGYFATLHDSAPYKYLDGRDYVTPEPMP